MYDVFNGNRYTLRAIAKQSALICVDVILNSHIDSVYEAYYLDVKKEIEKL